MQFSLEISPGHLENHRFGGFLKWGYPQIIHSNGIFHYKPSIWGYPHLWKPHISDHYFCFNEALELSMPASQALVTKERAGLPDPIRPYSSIFIPYSSHIHPSIFIHYSRQSRYHRSVTSHSLGHSSNEQKESRFLSSPIVNPINISIPQITNEWVVDVNGRSRLYGVGFLTLQGFEGPPLVSPNNGYDVNSCYYCP